MLINISTQGYTIYRVVVVDFYIVCKEHFGVKVAFRENL